MEKCAEYFKDTKRTEPRWGKRPMGLPIRQDAWDKSYEVDEYPTGDKERTLG